ncbi:MAG: DNA repair protein RadC [Oscillospiraceae bacterium]|nr:DNA repair protein RadC [Oscillospiraceae bacterium]
MSIHDGHRQRVRERFLNSDLTAFEDHEVLELLLFYCIPRCDTNEIAHRLVKRFGSFAQVLDAPVCELQKVEGIGESAAVFLSLMRSVSGYYQKSRLEKNTALTTISEYGNYLVPHFLTQRTEEVYLLCLDAKCMVLGCNKVGDGNINSTNISIRKIVDMAISSNATSVVLAHNHPSGIALPSAEDVATTKLVANALIMVDVILNDHIIVADNDYVSMVESNLYRPDDVYDELIQKVLRSDYALPTK